jgi:hypothetical protein
MGYKNDTGIHFSEEKRNRRKRALINALKKTQGLISLACEKVHVSRNFYYEQYKSDPDFRQECNDIIEKQKDIVEAAILSLVADKDPGMCRFYATHKMRDRGYVTKVELTRPEVKKDIDLSKFPPELIEKLEETLFDYDGENEK